MENWNDFIQSVRENKAQLLEKYGDIESLFKHQEEDRLRLEKEGWEFISFEEINMQNKHDLASVARH